MKIVYDHQIFTMQEYGGVSRYFVELAKQLTPRPDIELELLAPLHVNRHLERADLAIKSGVCIPRIPYSGRLLHHLNELMAYSRLRKQDPDIIHATFYSHINRLPGDKAKVVVTVHDMIHELYPDDFKRYDHTARMKRDAVNHSDHIICVSHNTRKDLLRLTGVDPQKVSVVYHGVNFVASASVSQFTGPKRPFLLFVGKRGGYKNFIGLLKAYSDSAELKENFEIVCFGGGGFTSKERSIQKHLGLKHSQIQWFGGNDATLAELYKTATAFIYPSLYEGFGIPPLEAMSFNCPVVCSNGGSIPEIVGGAGEFFDPLNTQDMVRAITRVVSSDSYTRDLCSLGQDQLKRYSWSKCAKETLEIYQSLVQFD